MNVALSELPDFTCLPGRHGAAAPSARASSSRRRSRTWTAPTPSARETGLVARAHRRDADSQHRGRLARAAAASTWRASSASTSATRCRTAATGTQERERAADAVIEHVTRFAPNFKSRGARPARAFAARPRARVRPRGRRHLPRQAHPEPAVQRAPGARPRATTACRCAGLYLCGAGAHPGGGVTGVPGHNAAREIIRDRAWRRRA